LKEKSEEKRREEGGVEGLKKRSKEIIFLEVRE
jgi:hypothetical protein